LENQKLNNKITSMEQTIQNMDKKKSKLKEFEETVSSKLDAKKAEIAELKASHSKEVAFLQRTIDEQLDKVESPISPSRSPPSLSLLIFILFLAF
jgi:phage shock protein A